MEFMWWLVIGIGLILAITFMQFRHLKHRAVAIVVILILLFVYLTSNQILSGQDINYKSADGIAKAAKIYFNWLIHIGGNLKAITGNAVKMDWTGNITNATA